MPVKTRDDNPEVTISTGGTVLNTNLKDMEKDFTDSDVKKKLVENLTKLPSIASRKHQARIESIGIAKKTDKGTGCTLKLTYSDKLPEGTGLLKEFKYPSESGLLQLRYEKEAIALKLTNFDVSVRISDGVHTATCKPLHSFDVESLKFLYSHRLVSDEGNEIEMEFIPTQRRVFDE